MHTPTLPEHEAKFPLDARRVGLVLGLLGARALPDPDHPDGRVNSVYFDTLDLRSFAEKLNSDFSKTKVRARWYADPQSGEPLGVVHLERKRREGTRRSKQRLTTDVPAARLAAASLSSSLVAALPTPLWSEGSPPHGPLVATLEVSYRRRRFVDPASGARLALDTDIRVSRTNATFYPSPPPFALDRAVLEVKGPIADLPPALEGLRRLGCRRGSFSKYGACVEQVLLARYGRLSA